MLDGLLHRWPALEGLPTLSSASSKSVCPLLPTPKWWYSVGAGDCVRVSVTVSVLEGKGPPITNKRQATQPPSHTYSHVSGSKPRLCLTYL